MNSTVTFSGIRKIALKSRQAILDKLRSAIPLIAPSMLKCDFSNLHREIELLESAGAEVLHFDVMDGHFVPNLSYGPMIIERLRPMTCMVFDAHLMISEPERFLDDYICAGCDCITFHREAVSNPGPLLRRIQDAGKVAGLALNPGTSLTTIEPFLEDCDLLLVMSVEPGFGGQQFIPESIEKLEQLRRLVSPETLISIDGGIGKKTIACVAEAGAQIFVAGSAIFDADDYTTAIHELHSLAGTHTVSPTAQS